MVVVLIQGACAFGPPASTACYSPPKGDSVNANLTANYTWFTNPFFLQVAKNNFCQNYQCPTTGDTGSCVYTDQCIGGGSVHISVQGQSFQSFKIYWQESLLSKPGSVLLGLYSDNQCAYLEHNVEFNCPGAPIISQTVSWCYDISSLDLTLTDSTGNTFQIGSISGQPQNIHNDCPSGYPQASCSIGFQCDKNCGGCIPEGACCNGDNNVCPAGGTACVGPCGSHNEYTCCAQQHSDNGCSWLPGVTFWCPPF